MTEQTGVLTNLQLEILQIFKYRLEEEQLLEIRELLAGYFAEKATREMDSLWEEKGWSEATMEAWSNEHFLTKYDIETE